MEEGRKVVKGTGASKKVLSKKSSTNEISSVSDEAMERLVEVMTDAPTLVKLANAGWEIKALKPAVQWEIAKIACEITKEEKACFGDVIKSFSGNLPNVIRVVTLCLLNDKKRIAEEYDKVYDTLMWESEPSEWATLLFEIYQKIDVGFFFQITDAIQIFKKMTLERKMTTKELRQ